MSGGKLLLMITTASQSILKTKEFGPFFCEVSDMSIDDAADKQYKEVRFKLGRTTT